MPINYSLYHPDWKDIIRPDILKRDKFKCRFCGIKHKIYVYRDESQRRVQIYFEDVALTRQAGFKPFKIILTIAHLDQDVNNNNYSNLAALCQACHLNLDRPFKTLKRRSNPAS